MCKGWSFVVAGVVLFVAIAARSAENASRVGQPISTAEAKALARRIERSIEISDARTLDEIMDFDALVERCLSGLTDDERFRAGFKKGLTRDSFGGRICKSVGRYGSYRLLRLHKGADGQPRMLFRHVSDGRGLTYHDLELARDGDGAVRIVDVHNYAMGQSISRTMRYMAAMSTADGATSMAAFARAKPDLDMVTQAQKHGKFKQAWEAYERLPEGLRTEKTVMLARAEIGARLGIKEYAEAEGAFERAYPDDAALDFVRFDYLVRKREADGALAALDRIEKSAGGDPYLDVLRAQACFQFGRWPQGKKALERFLEFGPTYKEGYVVGVDAALRVKDWGEVVRLIRLSRAKADMPWGGVDVVPAMAEFRKSAEYKQWKREEAIRNGVAGERF
jgi:tetratricopeptide (TPR) repeat protein